MRKGRGQLAFLASLFYDDDSLRLKIYTNLSDDLEDLVLLESLSGDVEGEILRVDDSSDEVEVLGDQILTVVHDEDSSNVELDVVSLLLGLEEIEGSPGNEKRVEEKEVGRVSFESFDSTRRSSSRGIEKRRKQETYLLGT